MVSSATDRRAKDADAAAGEKKTPRINICDECGIYPVPKKGMICDGCEAYREHQQ